MTGKQDKSNRESLITFIGDEVGAVRWRQYRIYPKEFTMTTGNPPMTGLAGRRAEGNGFPAIFNIEADPREEVNVVGTNAWVVGPYLKLIGEYEILREISQSKAGQADGIRPMKVLKLVVFAQLTLATAAVGRSATIPALTLQMHR